ncbi:MAG: hypothetical protein ABW136_10935 [Steroidobacteraceae bacterium]
MNTVEPLRGGDASRLERRAPATASLQRRGATPIRGARILLIGAYRQSLTVARSLNAAGMTVILGRAAGKPTPFERSRAVSDVWEHPPISSLESFAVALERLFVGSDAPDYVLPLGDPEIALLAVLRPLCTGAIVVAVAPEIQALCQDKHRLLARAAGLGVPTLSWDLAESAGGLRRAAQQLGYPLVVKANHSGSEASRASIAFVGGKARFLTSEEELEGLLRSTPFPAAGVLVQQRALGPRHNVYFAASNGRIRGLAEIATDRTDRPDGTGFGVEGRSVALTPSLVEQTTRLVAALQYTGVGCAQFLVDPATERSCFLELNARLGANCASVVGTGFDLPRLFIELMSGDVAMQPDAKVGVRYAWLAGDIEGLLECRRAGTLPLAAALRWLGSMTRAQWRANTHITFDWRDPRPSVTTATRRVSKMAASLFRTSAR